MHAYIDSNINLEILQIAFEWSKGAYVYMFKQNCLPNFIIHQFGFTAYLY